MNYKQCPWSVYETINYEDNIAPFKGYYSGPLWSM